MKLPSFITLLLLFGLVRAMGNSYESQSQIEISGIMGYDVAKLAELVKSKPFLERLAVALDATEKKAEAENLDKRLEELGRRISVRQGREKDTYLLLARGPTEEDAKELGRLIFHALSEEIKNQVLAQNHELLEALNRQLKEQERVVEEKRALLEKQIEEWKRNQSKDEAKGHSENGEGVGKARPDELGREG